MKRLYIVAFALAGVALGPALAHLFELPNKMALGETAYFTVQGIYAGWAMFGFVIFPEALVLAALAVALRRQRRSMLWALAALAAVVGAQVLFWTFTFPANQATANWTVVPENWRTLRLRWEYSHAAGALLNFAALMALVGSLLNWTAPPGAGRDGYSSNSTTG